MDGGTKSGPVNRYGSLPIITLGVQKSLKWENATAP